MTKGTICTTCRNIVIDTEMDYTHEQIVAYENGWGELAWKNHPNGGVITFDGDGEPEFLDMSARCLICETGLAGDYYAVTFIPN